MNIFIVDDHELIREGLKKVLQKEADFQIIGEANDTSMLFEKLREVNPDVIILDITMPGRSGLDIIKDIKLLSPSAKILILSMHPEERFALRSLKSGADGYLTKETASKELVKAVRKITGGGRYISSELAEQLLFEIENPGYKALHEQLSHREFEVLRMIGMGKSVSEIADQLNLSINTITSYRARLMEKMNMKNNAEIIRYVLENQLVE